jgi:hypothetical protein
VVDDFGFPDQPMLDEMTDTPGLSKNPKGFVAMIEGGSIDKQAHLMDSERWIIDTIESTAPFGECPVRDLSSEDGRAPGRRPAAYGSSTTR